jgi:electron transfer flavoprotein alpha subunit
MSVVVVVEHRDGAIVETYREAAAAAAALSSEVIAVIVGTDAAGLATSIDAAGLSEVVAFEVGDGQYEPDMVAAGVVQVARERGATLVIATSSATALGWGAAAAIQTGGGYAADVITIVGSADGVQVRRGLYGGKVLMDVGLTVGSVVLLRPGAFISDDDAAGTPTLTTADLGHVSRSRHRGFRSKPSGDVDITEADFVIAVGRGVGEQEGLETFSELAGALGATLAVSRPLVDAGWVAESRQVGQSGRTVSPKVYLAFGISGAVQHIAGMNTSGTVIAVNTDPTAAIFNVADFGVTIDMFAVASQLRAAWQN